MSAALAFGNLTLGYDRHPAVHHLHGEVKSGALMAVVGPNGAGKSTLFKGIVGMLKPLAGGIDLCGAARARHRLSAAGRRHRPHVPDQRLRHGRDGPVARGRPVRRHRQARARQGARRDVGGRPVGLRGAADRHALGRADAAHAVRAAAAAGRARDRARRAVQRDRHQDRRRPVRSGAALARREAHRDRGAARSRAGQVDVPRGAAAGARAGRVGRDQGRADGGESAEGAAHVRGVRRARRARVGCAKRRHDLRHAHRPLRRVRLHAPRAGRHASRSRSARGRSACS